MFMILTSIPFSLISIYIIYYFPLFLKSYTRFNHTCPGYLFISLKNLKSFSFLINMISTNRKTKFWFILHMENEQKIWEASMQAYWQAQFKDTPAPFPTPNSTHSVLWGGLKMYSMASCPQNSPLLINSSGSWKGAQDLTTEKSCQVTSRSFYL